MNLCPVVGGTLFFASLAVGVLALLGWVTWWLVHLPWRNVLFGVAIVLGGSGFLLGMWFALDRGPTWEISKIVGAWVVAKKGKYCPEAEFVEED